MKKGLYLFAGLYCLIIWNPLFSQSGESNFKKVIINSSEKKISPLFPAFELTALNFIDSNQNHYLEGYEDGSIRFYIKNTGSILLREIDINVYLPDSLKSINFSNTQIARLINIGDSALVNIPVTTDGKLKDGVVEFKVYVSDPLCDSTRTAALSIPTRESAKTPLFSWESPGLPVDSIGSSVTKITGLVKSGSNITGLRIYLNGLIADDNKSFNILATENLNEFRIERTIVLNEGINEIKIEVRNDAGVTVSDTRFINYAIPKIDHTYVEKRLALVIGNANYLNSNPLRNPINDAEAISSALKDLGFTVLKYLNSDLKTMKKAMDEFGEKLHKFNVGLFYYAGHGIQVKGNNYLIPVDASLRVEQDVDYDCVDAGRLLGKMEAAGSNTNIVIFDACRDNPFSRSWTGRGLAKEDAGLAFMNAPSGTIIAYATSPGKIAADGTGKNGIYTEALLKYINESSLPIEDFFKYVRIDVEKKTNRTQTPWESTSLKGNFYFKLK